MASLLTVSLSGGKAKDSSTSSNMMPDMEFGHLQSETSLPCSLVDQAASSFSLGGSLGVR